MYLMNTMGWRWARRKLSEQPQRSTWNTGPNVRSWQRAKTGAHLRRSWCGSTTQLQRDRRTRVVGGRRGHGDGRHHVDLWRTLFWHVLETYTRRQKSRHICAHGPDRTFLNRPWCVVCSLPRAALAGSSRFYLGENGIYTTKVRRW